MTARPGTQAVGHTLFGFQSDQSAGPLKNRSCSEVHSPLSFQEGDIFRRIHRQREAGRSQSPGTVTSVTENNPAPGIVRRRLKNGKKKSYVWHLDAAVRLDDLPPQKPMLARSLR